MPYWPATELNNLRVLGGGQDAPVRLIDTGRGSFNVLEELHPIEKQDARHTGPHVECGRVFNHRVDSFTLPRLCSLADVSDGSNWHGPSRKAYLRKPTEPCRKRG